MTIVEDAALEGVCLACRCARDFLEMTEERSPRERRAIARHATEPLAFLFTLGAVSATLAAAQGKDITQALCEGHARGFRASLATMKLVEDHARAASQGAAS